MPTVNRQSSVILLAAFIVAAWGRSALDVPGLGSLSSAEAQVRRTAPATRPAAQPSSPQRPKTSPAGGKAAVAGTPVPRGPAGKGELLQDEGTVKPEKFKAVTKEEADASIDQAKRKADFVAKELGITLHTLETDHFIIFTDWAKGDHNFLKTNLEQAYTAVSRQFDIPVSQNVFVGRLPVYMFDLEDDFQSYAMKFDRFDAKMVLGYYAGNEKGQGSMAMWKPRVENPADLKQKQREWAYTLVHEFTHAFIARYRTNAFIPRWLNEGLAEVIASGQFPRPEIYPYVRSRAGEVSVTALLKQTGMLAGEDYPVVRTVVETMIKGNRKGFLALFNDVKDGKSFDEALLKHFRCDARGLEAAWRKYIVTAR